MESNYAIPANKVKDNTEVVVKAIKGSENSDESR